MPPTIPGLGYLQKTGWLSGSQSVLQAHSLHLYLNAKSHHHPSNKQAVLSTLIHRARALCDEDSLQAELVFLKDLFKENGYNDRQIHRALNRRPHLPQQENEPHSVAFLPIVGKLFDRISRVLARHNIKSVGLPHMK
jgi:hypothetical protein